MTEEQMKDVQDRINETAPKIAEILKSAQLAVSGKVIKIEIGPGAFADSVQVGYVDTKFTESKPEEPKQILKED